MNDKKLLEFILSKEGATEAFQELSTQFNINDSVQLRQNWTEVEELLLKFTVKKYSISQDFLLSETVIQPFKTGEEIQEVKEYLLN
jgi:hypothetical protein